MASVVELSRTTLEAEEELVKFELEEFVRSFELEAGKPRWIETRMVNRGRDADHRKRIFCG